LAVRYHQNRGDFMSKDFNAKVKLLVKSEKALLSLEMRKKSRQTLFIALALLAVLVALVMMNITMYLYLATSHSSLESATILTLLNLFIAGIFFVIALKQDIGVEAESIEEIRDFAWRQVNDDINEVKHSVSEFKDSFVKVKKGVDSFSGGSSFGIKNILPIVTTLIDLNKRR
jgi:hypothetical protein